MATFAKVNDFLEGAMDGEHNLGADTIEFAFTNTAPGSETNNPLDSSFGDLSELTVISYTNWADDMTVDRVCESVTSDEAAGTYTFDADDIVITATGGAIATFRYLYLFNQTALTPDDQLISHWDHGSTITLAQDESATITVNASGFFTVA